MRRGSMHWLADELRKAGWRVRFVTFGISSLSRLTGDVRLQGASLPQKGATAIADDLDIYFQVTPFHPIDLRKGWLNALAAPIFATFPSLWASTVRWLTRDADLVILESGLPVLLAPLTRRHTKGKLVYRVNDDVRVMRTPPAVRRAEIEYAGLFDRISLASPVLAQRFQSIGKVGLDPMGLETRLFDQPTPSPFDQPFLAPRWEVEAVCAGASHFDADAVRAMARLRPSWRFHILGRLRAPIDAPNIVGHGELPFSAVVPFVQHADIGLAPYNDIPGVEYQVHHSNRLLQYAYARLPSVGPARMAHHDAPFLVPYEPNNDESIDRALTTARLMDRDALPNTVPQWRKLAEGILNGVGLAGAASS
jgi:2-beta-glucuronyltransferase